MRVKPRRRHSAVIRPSHNASSCQVFAYTGQRIANSSPHLFLICDASSSLTMGGELSAYGPRLHLFFWRRIMERLPLREALASDRLEAFVRQEEASGVELVMRSDLERALALLITIRWSENHRLRSRSFGRDR